MANDLQNRSKQTDGVQTAAITNQNQSDPSPFTPEQRQILGKVYRLILGWRRERLMKAKRSTALAEGQA